MFFNDSSYRIALISPHRISRRRPFDPSTGSGQRSSGIGSASATPPQGVSNSSVNRVPELMCDHRQHYLRVAGNALANYELGEVHIDARKPVGHIGFSSYSMVKFRADGASGSYLVTVYYAKGNLNIHDYRKVIRSHLLWLDALDGDTDLIVQKPVLNLSGDFITDVEYDGDRPFLVTLLRWVDGELVWDNYGDEVFVDLPSGTLHNVGTVLGKLHRHSSQWTPPEGFVRPGIEPERLGHDLNRLRPAAVDGRIHANDFTVLERAVSHTIDRAAEMDKSPDSGDCFTEIFRAATASYIGARSVPLISTGVDSGTFRRTLDGASP